MCPLEGERTAYYESSQSTIKKNSETIRQLRQENKRLYRKQAEVNCVSLVLIKLRTTFITLCLHDYGVLSKHLEPPQTALWAPCMAANCPLEWVQNRDHILLCVYIQYIHGK